LRSEATREGKLKDWGAIRDVFLLLFEFSITKKTQSYLRQDVYGF